ncbi:hypothetical protein O181_063127, partial [Austropuccinia psidii MF-1]|nr:hypothetical protein [Austropuccinia psidii MF-1]
DKSRGNTSPLPSNYQELKEPKLPEPEHPPFNYRRVIGLLQYLVQCTRPDLAYSISFLSQFLESPKDRHYQAVIHVLKYLNFTKNLELRLGCKKLTHSLEEIVCFSDSDWGGAKENRSFSGSIIYYHGSLGWRSQKQRVVALSSAEAEYNALSSCCQDSEWICQLIFEITNKKITSIIYSDNQSSIALASNRFYHHSTRHINFRLHFIRSLVEDEKIVLKYISTQNMLADLLTKNLPLAKSHNLLKTIFGQEIQSKLTALCANPSLIKYPNSLATNLLQNRWGSLRLSCPSIGPRLTSLLPLIGSLRLSCPSIGPRLTSLLPLIAKLNEMLLKGVVFDIILIRLV